MQSSFSESELNTKPGVRNYLLKKPQQQSIEAKMYCPEELLPSLMFSVHAAPSAAQTPISSWLFLQNPSASNAFMIFLTVSPCAYMAVPLLFVRTTINPREITSEICQKFIWQNL